LRCPPALSPLRIVLFFFQAEDGIRDFHVTGVQTCALPISAGQSPTGLSDSETVVFSTTTPLVLLPAFSSAYWSAVKVVARVSERSEERRVGKECRARGAPYS